MYALQTFQPAATVLYMALWQFVGWRAWMRIAYVVGNRWPDHAMAAWCTQEVHGTEVFTDTCTVIGCAYKPISQL